MSPLVVVLMVPEVWVILVALMSTSDEVALIVPPLMVKVPETVIVFPFASNVPAVASILVASMPSCKVQVPAPLLNFTS